LALSEALQQFKNYFSIRKQNAGRKPAFIVSDLS